MFSNRDLKKLIIPLIIEQTLSITIGMTDIMMISVAGEAAVSGVSLVDMINMLLLNIFAALSTGGAVVSAHYLGKKERGYANESAKQLLIVTLAISVVIMIIALLGNRRLLHLVYGNIGEDVMKNAVTYLSISAFSYPFIALYNSGAALFRTMGNSKISMMTALFMNIIHITSNAVLLYGFHFGVEGIAISSLLSRMLSCMIMLTLLKSSKNMIYIDKYFSIRPKLSIIKKILHIGIPNSFENSFFQLGRILLVSVITFYGTVQITANAVANTIDYFGCIPAQAIGLAMITVVGRCVGAGDYQQARHYTKKLMKTAYGISVILHLLILAFLPLILDIYRLSEDTYSLARLLVVIHEGSAIFIWPASFTMPNALRASGDVRYTMVTSISSMVLMRIGLGILLGMVFKMGAMGVWIGMIVDWLYRAVFFSVRFKRGKWMYQKI